MRRMTAALLAVAPMLSAHIGSAAAREPASAQDLPRMEIAVGTEPGKGAIWALAVAQDAGGRTLTLAQAAARLGVDHFNWMQYVIADPDLAACRRKEKLEALAEGCGRLLDAQGRYPALPAIDPPLGGWRYEGKGFPTADYRPFYWDEYFSPSGDPAPASPEYRDYQSRLDHLPTRPGEYEAAEAAPLGQARGFFFNDRPIDQNDGRSVFIDVLVGVRGAGCNRLDPTAPCYGTIIPGTGFAWFLDPNGHIGWQAISVERFVTLSGNSTQSLAALGVTLGGAPVRLSSSAAAAVGSAPDRAARLRAAE